MWIWDRYHEIAAKLEAELRHQVNVGFQRIVELEEERDQLKAKIERMELVLMPLSSQAGSAYIRSLNPSPKLPPKVTPSDNLSWSDQLKKFMADTEAADKEKTDGVSS